jgi:hypothetical protein
MLKHKSVKRILNVQFIIEIQFDIVKNYLKKLIDNYILDYFIIDEKIMFLLKGRTKVVLQVGMWGECKSGLMYFLRQYNF